MPRFLLPRFLLCLWAGALLPLLLLTGLRLASTETFARLEHRRLPPDAYGLDRPFWDHEVQAFLLQEIPVEDFSRFEFSDSQLAPGREFGIGKRAFCDREIQHLTDIRTLLLPALAAWHWLASGWLLGLGLLARQGRLVRPLRAASATALGVLTAATLLAAVGADRWLSLFHQQCFQGNSYLFYTTDTLIRLYPHAYWRDFVMFVAVFSLLTAAGLLAATHLWPQRK